MKRISIADWIYEKIRSAIAIVQDGDTATRTIASGKYVIWKGILCKAKAAIPSGTTLSSTNLEAVSNGGLNELHSDVETLNSKLLKVVNVPRYSGDGIGAGQCMDKTLDCSGEIEAGWLPVGIVSCVANGGKFIASLSSIPTSRSSINVRLVNVDAGVVYPGNYTVGMLIAKS